MRDTAFWTVKHVWFRLTQFVKYLLYVHCPESLATLVTSLTWLIAGVETLPLKYKVQATL